MRLAVVAAACLLALSLNVQAEMPALRIAEIYPNPSEGAREFVELWNPTTGDVQLHDWVVSDAAGNAFQFPDWLLAPGGRVVIWGGGSGDASGPAWSRSSVWNNAGDTVYVHDAAGRLVDTFAYGADGAAAAPPQGQSLQWDSNWTTGEPTPGRAPGTVGGEARATVENVPPRLQVHAPQNAAPGSSITFAVQIQDDNGDAVTLRVTGPGETRTYEGTGWFNDTWSAPNATGAYVWRFEATDGAHHVWDNASVRVDAAILQVIMPAGGVTFPPLAPGARDVHATAPFVVENRGAETLQPRLDISPLRGPQTIPVDGNMAIIVDGERILYSGPLTALPSLDAGARMEVTLVLLELPVPLAAGPYGTSFAVTP